VKPPGSPTASSDGSSRSSCHTGTASASSAPSAQRTSRSSCDPGYVTTPILGCGLDIVMQLDLVRLDERVREQLLAHAFHLRASARLVIGAHLEVDDLADPGAGDGEAEMLERALDRFALRVEDAGLARARASRSEEHTSELQSPYDLVCRLLLEKKKESRNVPAVKILAKFGVQNLIPYIRKFGITSQIEPVLPIALGAAAVTLMEMFSDYSSFLN